MINCPACGANNLKGWKKTYDTYVINCPECKETIVLDKNSFGYLELELERESQKPTDTGIDFELGD